MGYAVPVAIGEQLCAPDKPVVALVGDGCMRMTADELAVAAEHGLPIVVVVLNDAALTLIKLKQSKMQMDPRAVDFGSPRHDAIAEGFGARGIRVETVEDFDAALREAVASRRSEEHTSELQSLMRISYAVFCLKKKNRLLQKTP